jgi:hypothetical protein
MAIGDGSQAASALITEKLKGALTELAGGRPREGAMEAVDLGERTHVSGGIAPSKRLGGWSAAVADTAGVAQLGNQAGHLGS